MGCTVQCEYIFCCCCLFFRVLNHFVYNMSFFTFRAIWVETLSYFLSQLLGFLFDSFRLLKRHCYNNRCVWIMDRNSLFKLPKKAIKMNEKWFSSHFRWWNYSPWIALAWAQKSTSTAENVFALKAPFIYFIFGFALAIKLVLIFGFRLIFLVLVVRVYERVCIAYVCCIHHRVENVIKIMNDLRLQQLQIYYVGYERGEE